MIALRALTLLLALLALAACGGSKTKLEKLERNDVVLAFGDSLTFGTGARTEESYPAALEREIGSIPDAGLRRDIRARPRKLPDVLTNEADADDLCHGHDFLRRLDEAQAARNVRAMISLARSKGVAVVLLATPKPGLPPAIPAFYGELAAELGVPYEEAVIRKVLLDNSLKSDMVHPNGKGYAQMAVALQKVLQKAGAI